MITVTARPKADKNHIVVEKFKSVVAAEQWKQVLIRNGWEVV
jgi:hypothetical protein